MRTHSQSLNLAPEHGEPRTHNCKLEPLQGLCPLEDVCGVVRGLAARRAGVFSGLEGGTGRAGREHYIFSETVTMRARAVSVDMLRDRVARAQRRIEASRAERCKF